MAQLEAAAKESGSVRTRSHLALARAAFLIETRKWGEAKAPVASKDLPKDAAIAELFANGLAAARTGNRTGIANAMQQMAALMEEAPVNGAPVRSNPSAPARPGVSPITRGPVAVAPPGTTRVAPQAPPAPRHTPRTRPPACRPPARAATRASPR